jgi:hypothetical protein
MEGLGRTYRVQRALHSGFCCMAGRAGAPRQLFGVTLGMLVGHSHGVTESAALFFRACESSLETPSENPI